LFTAIGARVATKGGARRHTALFLLFLLVLSCAAMVYSAQSYRDRLDEVRASDSDNAGWLISQLDVDHKALALAVDRALLANAYSNLQEPALDLSDVRLRFDIFYSRVDTVLASLRREAITPELTSRLVVLADLRSDLADRIDSLADNDPQGLVQFANDVAGSAPVVRSVTTLALLYYVAQSDDLREQERALLQRFWGQSIVLLGLMIISAALALRLWRELEDRSTRMQRALATVSKVFDASQSAIVVSDMHGRILLANPAATEIFRVSADEMTQYNIEDVMIPRGMRGHHRQMMHRHHMEGHRKMIGAGPVRMEAARIDGDLFKAEVSLVADTDLEGKPILIGFIRDISDIVAAEEKLVIARDEAQKHASAKTMFLATMSHEMRTPLHGVIASLDLIDDAGLTNETRQFLQTARDCSDRALQQVNDVLEITRLGESRLGLLPFDAVEVAENILGELRPMAATKSISLDLQVTGDRPDRLCLGLSNAFSRALYNLAGNAVKFTERGQVTIALHYSQINDDETQLRVAVSDTGIGIAPEDQERIFAEFETVDQMTLYTGSGTGLGLPIVRLAVSRLGGQLSLQSHAGSGSTFCFEITLPYIENEAPQKAQDTMNLAPQIAPMTAMDVLVVDDNDVNVALMVKMVSRMGHRPAQAKNGLDAVAIASARAFDIILMDVSMPVMDGREATSHIRSSGLSAQALIIGVTAFSDEGRIADLTHAGMDAVLTKPVNTAALTAAITGALHQRETAQTSDQTTDLDRALRQLEEMLDRDHALRFIGQALDDVATHLPVMADADVTMEQMTDTIHSVVGSTAVVGLSQLSQMLAKAEDAARNGDRAGVASMHGAISQALATERANLAAVCAD
jgi:PAS domain S-box-containing protein